MSKGADTLPSHVLDAAAEWLLQIHSGEASDADRDALDNWRRQHPDHERAWRRAQDFLQTVHDLPPRIGKRALDRPASLTRRRAVRHLALLLGAGSGAWLISERLPWQSWTAGIRTATGERRTVTLDDGTQVILNTASALDVHFDERQRRLQLHAGEILVSTAWDPAGRPFFVHTAQGRVQAIGTRFSVRQDANRTEVAVYEGAVDLYPARSESIRMRLEAGQLTTFDQYGAEPSVPVSTVATLWTRGMLVVENTRLETVVAELDRYRPGRLRCAPQVADLRISGAFPLTDIPRSLQLIQNVLPVRVQSPLPYWAVIEPRD